MAARTSIEYNNGGRHISMYYHDQKPVGYYVVEIGDRDAILIANLRVMAGENGALELLQDFETMLSDIAFMLRKLTTSVIENAISAAKEKDVDSCNWVIIDQGIEKK